jgi:hypothetical protein
MSAETFCRLLDSAIFSDDADERRKASEELKRRGRKIDAKRN